MARHTPVTLRAVIAACPALRYLPRGQVDPAAAAELAESLQVGFDAVVTTLGVQQLTSPKATLDGVVRALEGPADILLLAAASHIVRFTRREKDLWAFALPASIPGRPSSMIRFDELAQKVAEVGRGRPLLLCLNAEMPWTDKTTAVRIVDELIAAWPPHSGVKPAVVVSVHSNPSISALHALERTLTGIACTGHSIGLDDAATQVAEFLSSLGIDSCASRSGGGAEIQPIRSDNALPAYIRDDLFAADPGSRLDAAAELAHLASTGDQYASEELARLASRDRAPQVRTYAHTLMNRRARPRAANSPAQQFIPSAVRAAAAGGQFMPDLLPHSGGRVSIGVDPPDGEPGDRPRHYVELAPFRLSRTPVTDRQYLTFVLDDNGPIPDHWATESDIWNDDMDRPVVMVSFHDAIRYCAWLTDRLHMTGVLASDEVVTLPSEAEWEAAASNGRGEHHPWGDIADPSRCNIRATAVNQPSRVCAYSPRGDNEAGCADLLGNVWEWTRSLWGPSYRSAAFAYPYDPSDGREDSGRFHMRRVVRGGAFYYATDCADSHTRNRMMPERRHPGGGFRVAAIGERSGQQPSATALEQ